MRSPDAPLSGKERLLEAAGSLFAASGYSEVGVADILKLAGVQPPTLYHHYQDKEGLYVAWLEKSFGNLTTRINSGSLEAFAATLSTTIDFDLHRVLSDANRLSRPDSRERAFLAYARSIYDPLTQLLVRSLSPTKEARSQLALQAEVFLAGLLAAKRSSQGTEAAKWWSDGFLRAYGPPEEKDK